MIVSENFDMFGHIHPEDFGEETEVQFTFPQAGKYGVAIDFVANNTPGNKLFSVQVNGPSLGDSTISDSKTEPCFTSYPEEGKDKYTQPFIISKSEASCEEGYKASFSYQADNAKVSYPFEKNGTPVPFDPYLGKVMHLAVVDENFKKIIHTRRIK